MKLYSSVLIIWNVQSEPTTPQEGCKGSLAFVFCLLFLTNYEGWIFTAVYCVQWRVIVQLIFAEIYNIVLNIFFQCFPHNIWSNGVCCAQHVFYQIIKKGMYYRKFVVLIFFSQTNHKVNYLSAIKILSSSRRRSDEIWNLFNRQVCFPSTSNESSEPHSQTWSSNHFIASVTVIWSIIKGKQVEMTQGLKKQTFGQSCLLFEFSNCWTLSLKCKQEGQR